MKIPDPSFVFPTFSPDDPITQSLFRDAGVTRLKTMFKEGPIEVYPNLMDGGEIMSNDLEFQAVKLKIAAKATKRCPPSVDDLGRVTGNGIRSNFYGLQHLNGFPMLPGTVPVSSNIYLREQAGLSNDWLEPWHRAMFLSLCHWYLDGIEPQAMDLAEDSSTMQPFYTRFMPHKLNLARWHLKSLPQAMELVYQEKYREAWDRYALGGSYHTVYRQQSSDKITLEKGVFTPKDRVVTDELFAVTGGRKGHRSVANKHFGPEVDFRVLPGMFRTRNRSAKGSPFGMTVANMVIAKPVRKNIYRKGGYTYHHRTREETEGHLRRWKFVIPCDVTDHDIFYPLHMILPLLSEAMLEKGFHPHYVKTMETSMRLALYVTGVGPGVEPLLIGNPFEPTLLPGLSSGSPWTDLLGSILMTGVYAHLQIEHTAPHHKKSFQGDASRAMVFWDNYLSGKLDIALKDKSDDGLLGWTDPALVNKAQQLLSALKNQEATGKSLSPYMLVSYEHGGAYLGSILLYPESVDPSGLILIGNGNSLLVNQFNPEYTCDYAQPDRSRVKRPFPGLAWSSLKENYGGCPAFGDLMDIVEEEFYNQYGWSYRAFREKLEQADVKRLNEFVARRTDKTVAAELPMIDRVVLSDRQKVHYRYEPDQLTPFTRDLLFNGLPLEEVEPIFNYIVRRR